MADVRLTDVRLAAEIELLGEVITVVADHDGPLSPDEVDEVLGATDAERTLKRIPSRTLRRTRARTRTRARKELVPDSASGGSDVAVTTTAGRARRSADEPEHVRPVVVPHRVEQPAGRAHHVQVEVGGEDGLLVAGRPGEDLAARSDDDRVAGLDPLLVASDSRFQTSSRRGKSAGIWSRWTHGLTPMT